MKKVTKKMKLIFITLVIFITLPNLSSAQNGIIGSGFGTNNWSTTDCFSDGPGGTRIITLTPNGTGFQYFRLVTCWDGNFNQWGPVSGSDYLVSDGTVVPATQILENSTSHAYYINVASTSDNYVFKTRQGGNPPGTRNLLVTRVQGPVRTVSSVTRNFANPNQFNDVEVTANLSGALSTGQGVYLRYTTNNFSTSTIVEMTGSGTAYTATIPMQIAGTNVDYYIFTARSGATISHADADFYTINLNNNGGPNYEYTVAASGLPVSLTSFSANCNEELTVITWTTASEFNASHFNVEMSRDGLTWNNIGRVEAAGTTSQTSNYQFAIETVGSTTYFRLVQVDFDGASEVYGPIMTQCDVSLNEVAAFPNPAESVLNLSVNSKKSFKQTQISILDMSGRAIMTQMVDIEEGSSIIPIQIDQLENGSYMLRFDNLSEQFQSIRFAK